MAKTSGSNRGGGKKNYEASVAVTNRNDETRWLQKRFSRQSSAEKWIDEVAERFDSPAKAGFATTASIDKDTKKGTVYDVYYRDLAKEYEAKDKREFRAGRGGYVGTKKKKRK